MVKNNSNNNSNSNNKTKRNPHVEYVIQSLQGQDIGIHIFENLDLPDCLKMT